jgi:hypothetical protein
VRAAFSPGLPRHRPPCTDASAGDEGHLREAGRDTKRDANRSQGRPLETAKPTTPRPEQVDEKRNSCTRATVDQMLDRYLTLLDVELTTRSTYEGYIRNYIRLILIPPVLVIKRDQRERTNGNRTCAARRFGWCRS